MRLFARNLFIFLSLVFLFAFSPKIVNAATTPFRSANIITTDGFIPYTNLNNCSTTDGNTCDRASGPLYGNLYFRDFGNYDDFGIPYGAIITKVRIRVTGKAKTPVLATYVGLSSGTTFTRNCQFPDFLWGMGNLNSSTITTQTFVTNLASGDYTQAVGSYCFTPYNFATKNFIWRINYSSAIDLNWSANIDNFEIAFDYDPPLTPPKIPLILIPGIGGSELKTGNFTIWNADNGHGGIFSHNYGANEKVWVNSTEAAKPGDDDYFDVLKMFDDGQTSQANLALTGKLFDGYQDAINFFIANGYTLNKDFFVFPYDWRLDVSGTASLLDERIILIKAVTGSRKVDIVAHSMGGLVARNYISDAERAANVRKLFTIGTPHLGAVNALKGIKYGNCLTDKNLENLPFCLGIARSEVKDVIQNMISEYELAPSQEYFDFYNGQDTNHLYPYKNNDLPLNYDQIKSILTNLNYNTGLFGPSELFHSLDNSLTNTNGVDVTNIAGSGLPTLGQIREKSVKDFFGNTIQKTDGFTINGDETVPLFSASLIDSSRNKSLLGNAKVFYTKQEHGALVTSGPALNLVNNILNSSSQLPAGVSTQAYLFTGTEVSVHSPVNIHVYDSVGNHTGPTSDGNFETNIPGSSYGTLDDAKFIWLPDGGQYNIKFEAIDQGSFDFKIKKFENDTISQETLYKDIPLTTLTKAEVQFDTSFTISPIMHLDEDGNGTVDQDINPSANLTGDAVFDEAPPNTNIQLAGVVGSNGWFKSDASVILNADDASGSGILKTAYSLDNGITINTYTGAFIISAEKINKLKFKSVDNAGNEEDPKEAEIKIDKTGPNILVNIPLGGAVYLLNQNIQVNYSCSDNGSGLESCVGSQASGTNLDTSSVGTKTFKIDAIDKAGNNLSQTVSYKVQSANNGTCLGSPGHVILQPINSDGTSVFKQGSTIPAKFRVCDINGISIGSADLIKSFNLIKTISGTTVSSINEPVSSTTPESNFRWDSTNQQWIFNMSTKSLSAGKTYFYRIGLNDLTNVDFSFGLR